MKWLTAWMNAPGWVRFLTLCVLSFLLLWNAIGYDYATRSPFGGMSAPASALVAFFAAGFVFFLIDRDL